MKCLLICPDERPAVASLSDQAPLAIVPVLGKTLIAYWLEHLSQLGARQVRILATDRPDQVRKAVGDGSRWGLKIEVTPEQRELTPDEARAKFRPPDAADWLSGPNDTILLDRFPGLSAHPLFDSYAAWFDAMLAWMPEAGKNNRVGLREVHHGVWMGLRSRVAPSATLTSPCWVGENVWVGPGAKIGPNAVLEDRSMVESSAEITGSIVGPETFVGSLTEVKDSLAWGSTLTNLKSGSCTHVPDAFLMCPLGRRHNSAQHGNWAGRVTAAIVLAASLPVASLLMLRSRIRGEPALRPRVAVRPRLANHPTHHETIVYYKLADCRGAWKNWPQLWNIVKGEFAWVGNRPLSPAEVSQLNNDFERLWLSAPVGLISLAHAEGWGESFTDEERACASFYAVQANWRLDLMILVRTFWTAAKNSMGLANRERP